ncbi:MAG TPA: 16S rRNA (guanine(966)-N(2))-methyltransferase RsmD [bacterium]
MTRVIAGARKGFRLATPKSPFVRPTTDRTKQVIFDVLSPYLSGSLVLDLFSGTGGLGIEALSRGATGAIFVESDAKVMEVLIQNLHQTGFSERSEVMNLSARAALKVLTKRGARFEVILADPPYEGSAAQETLAAVAPILKEGGWFALEHSSRRAPAEIDALFLKTRKKHGDSAISFYQHA